jgi:hypothetical protein
MGLAGDGRERAVVADQARVACDSSAPRIEAPRSR